MCTNPPFHCQLPFETERIHAAAIYCSDGRFGEHMDDFLHNALDLPRYDRLVIPGGPARLITRFAAQDEMKAAENDLEFLVKAHGLDRLVLIAHSGCAYYSSRLDLSADQIEAAQRTDLIDAAHAIEREIGLKGVETYFARLHNNAVQFETVT